MAVTRAYISRSHLRHNLRILQKKAGVPLCIALKADAYGHGAVEIARTAAEEGITAFGYARVSEALEVIATGIRGRHILYSVVADDEIETALRNGFELFISDLEYLRLIEDKAQSLGIAASVHVKVDTGMHRLGVAPEEALTVVQKVHESGSLSLAGVCTHFAAADDRSSTFTDVQTGRFLEVINRIASMGIPYRDIHAANSGGILYHSLDAFTFARPGISVYGYPPSAGDRDSGLLPVMELVSTVVQVKKVKAGEPVSYGLTQAPKGDSFIATIAAGYGDGYPRLLSSRGMVCIGGELYPVIGRVCMDQCLVDLGPKTDVRRGDSAVLFGGEPPSWDADDIAGAAGTISYEITCGITARVPRIYTE